MSGRFDAIDGEGFPKELRLALLPTRRTSVSAVFCAEKCPEIAKTLHLRDGEAYEVFRIFPGSQGGTFFEIEVYRGMSEKNEPIHHRVYLDSAFFLPLRI